MTPGATTDHDTEVQMDQDYDGNFSIPNQFPSFDNQSMAAAMQQQQQQLSAQMGGQSGSRNRTRDMQQTGFQGVQPPFDSFNPMLDGGDPFGLDATLHFPTSYSFDQQPK